MSNIANITSASRDHYRVLVVGDEVATCEALEKVLRAPHRSIEVRDTPRAALEFLQHNPIDLAFVDANMTGMTGMELAERIQNRCPRAQVMVCSGYFGAEVALQSATVNTDRRAQKPVNFGALIRLADSYVTD